MALGAFDERRLKGLPMLFLVHLALDLVEILIVRKPLTEALVELLFFDVVSRCYILGDSVKPARPGRYDCSVTVTVVCDFFFFAVADCLQQILLPLLPAALLCVDVNFA